MDIVTAVDDGIDNTKFQSSTVPTTTTTTTDSTILNNLPDKNSNLNMNDSEEERKGPTDSGSNLIITAAVVDNDNINNAKSSTECENSIGDLDGIRDEYYQVKGKYGSIYDRSDNANPPPLPPESPVHSNIPNDGVIKYYRGTARVLLK